MAIRLFKTHLLNERFLDVCEHIYIANNLQKLFSSSVLSWCVFGKKKRRILYVYPFLFVQHVPAVPQESRRGSRPPHPPELEFKMAVSHHEGAGN